MDSPKISVVMPAYNHELFVAEAIESVLMQSFSDFEFIIINDGSQDGTADIIKQYTDSRIVCYYQENAGSHAAINKGLSLAKGDYVSIINSDDLYRCNRLEVLYNKAVNDKLDFLVTDLTLIDRNSDAITDTGHIWIKWYEGLKDVYRKTPSPLMAILAGNYTISTSNFFFRRSIIGKIGYLSSLKYTLDYEYAIRAMEFNEKGFFFLVDTPLFFYRLHGDNTILKDPVAAHLEAYTLVADALKHTYGADIAPAIDHLTEMTLAIKTLCEGHMGFSVKRYIKKYIKPGTTLFKLAKAISAVTG
ncbi:MAG: glycosyltransferase [Nitrospirae bacterium YQR-1]